MPDPDPGLVTVKAPAPGGCRICGAVHDPEQPHDRDSLYYQNRFFRRCGRFPTWEDAMAHCSDEVKAAFRTKLRERSTE